MKEQGMMMYLNKKDRSKAFKTDNCQNRNEAIINRLVASVSKLQKKGVGLLR